MKVLGNDLGLNHLGINNLTNVYQNMSVESLVADIVSNGEGVIGLKGAVMVDTGIYTGRSPKDKYIVDELSSSDKIWWGDVNKKISNSVFNKLYEKVTNYYNHSDESKTYLFDGFAGADPKYGLNVRILAKRAWQSHFVHNMFIRPTKEDLVGFKPNFTIDLQVAAYQCTIYNWCCRRLLHLLGITDPGLLTPCLLN